MTDEQTLSAGLMLPDFLTISVIESSLPEMMPMDEYRKSRLRPRVNLLRRWRNAQ